MTVALQRLRRARERASPPSSSLSSLLSSSSSTLPSLLLLFVVALSTTTTTTTTTTAPPPTTWSLGVVVPAVAAPLGNPALPSFPTLPLPCEQDGTGAVPSPRARTGRLNVTIGFVYWPTPVIGALGEEMVIGLDYFVHWANTVRGGITIGDAHHWFAHRIVEVASADEFLAAAQTMACDRTVTMVLSPIDFVTQIVLGHGVFNQAKFQMSIGLQLAPLAGAHINTLSVVPSVRTGMEEPLRLFQLSGARRLVLISDGVGFGVSCGELLTVDDRFGFDVFDHYVIEFEGHLLRLNATLRTERLAELRANISGTVDAVIAAEQVAEQRYDVLLTCMDHEPFGALLVDALKSREWFPPAVIMYPQPVSASFTVPHNVITDALHDNDSDSDDDDNDDNDDPFAGVDGFGDTDVNSDGVVGDGDAQLFARVPAYFIAASQWRPYVGSRYFDRVLNGTGDDWARAFWQYAAAEKRRRNATDSVVIESAVFISFETAYVAMQRLSSLDDVHRAPTLELGAQRMTAALMSTRTQTFGGRIGFDSDGFSEAPVFLYQATDRLLTPVMAARDPSAELSMLPDDERRARFSHSGEITDDLRLIGNWRNVELRTVLPISAATDSLVFPQPAFDERAFTGGWWSESSEVAMGTLTIVFALTVVACGAAVAVLRRNKVMLASSLLFNSLFLVGALLALSTNFVWMLYTTDAACQARPWLLGLGLSMMFGALLCKTWRVYRMFRALKNYGGQRETGLFALVAAIVGVQIVFLAIWTGVAPLRAEFRVPDPVRPSTAYVECTGDNLVAWSAAQVTLLGIVLVVNVAMTLLIRHVKMVCFNESRYIIFSVYNMFTLGVVLVALQYSQAVDREPLYVLRSVFILFAVVASVWVLFISKFVLIYKKVDLTHRSGSRDTLSPGKTAVSVNRRSPGGNSGVSLAARSSTRGGGDGGDSASSAAVRAELQAEIERQRAEIDELRRRLVAKQPSRSAIDRSGIDDSRAPI